MIKNVIRDISLSLRRAARRFVGRYFPHRATAWCKGILQIESKESIFLNLANKVLLCKGPLLLASHSRLRNCIIVCDDAATSWISGDGEHVRVEGCFISSAERLPIGASE